jgi:hypothetical protein
MVSSSAPSLQVGRIDDRFDFLPGKELHSTAIEPFGGNSQHGLNNSKAGRYSSCCIAHKGPHSSQASVAGSDANSANLFQVVKKSQDQFCIQIGERQFAGQYPQTLLCKPEQEAERIAVAGDRLCAETALCHHMLAEETLK